MTPTIEDWVRETEQSQSLAYAARKHAEWMRRERRFFYLIAALVVAVVLALTWTGKVHASVASVFDARAEPQLGCWPWQGKALRPGALVVAHKTLPCGTRVRVCYRGRCAVARVRDRGPYVADREWDVDRKVQLLIRMPYGVLPVRAEVLR